MVVVEINSVSTGSTGKIMLGISEVVRHNGHQAYTFSAVRPKSSPAGHTYIGTRIESLINRTKSITTGISETGSKTGTQNFLKKLGKAKPSVIHLHNLHGWYLCVPMLFNYIKTHHIPVVWTLHDCWGFTAQCSHFSIEKCEKWKSGCYSCPRYRIYPYTLVDNTRKMWKLKKGWFAGVENMTIVTPSQWLADLVKESFLKEYPVKVIHNGIDLDVFKPTPSDFRERYGIPAEKSVLLGVAFGWGVRKGLDVFVELARRLDPEKYQIVLVGTDEKTDKLLPENTISIHRTQNQAELAEIYTAADLFVNPTREEVLGLVNIEALACGTPVVTFNTGGSPECIDSTCGSVVPCDDIVALEQEIRRICTESPFTQSDCLKRATLFDMHKRFQEYIDLYEQKVENI